jgi:hypothetical protein
VANIKAGALSKSSTPDQETVLITEQEREHMIAEAAYYNAMHRGFQQPDPERDWFLAEKQIDQQLNS